MWAATSTTGHFLAQSHVDSRTLAVMTSDADGVTEEIARLTQAAITIVDPTALADMAAQFAFERWLSPREAEALRAATGAPTTHPQGPAKARAMETLI